ncbi:hypothetical protein I5U57_06855 [Stenotrophomonas maltophilia]|uniref:Uncharacterized protein n=1 Tax=Stenotrophomonas maltophilia TaxID=40324 RepID=A0AA40XYC0_STEMA|nr:hypothetical protein [Stenotrophomonas geniculata]MBH1639167.1 hypothetical protein [Stenotrophomonas maltophilia]MCI1065155.1 hypothetical protein [Stenotrophomonas maltophilia]MCI1106275.1 hypothetical protein [Stenotrophomonas maltophilia]
MIEQPVPDPTITVLAAMIEGERWLNADSCAVLLGLTTPDGKPNRRGFLERLARRPSFPAPLQIGNEKKWKRSEVLRWADDERRSGP